MADQQFGKLLASQMKRAGIVSRQCLNHGELSVPAMLCFKAATEGLAFSSPRLGRTATIPPALVAGSGTNIGGGTCEHIRVPEDMASMFGQSIREETPAGAKT